MTSPAGASFAARSKDAPPHGAPLPSTPQQERQRQQQCLQHTLNNLLQQPQFTADDLNRAADGLGGHAQRSRLPLFFTGNWDVNTLMAALAPLQLVREDWRLILGRARPRPRRFVHLLVPDPGRPPRIAADAATTSCKRDTLHTF